MNPDNLTTAQQLRATLGLGSIFFLRMFGLFVLIPVLSLYAVDLAGATPLLIGLALGIYGLTQGLLQIPLGMISDRIGRKPVIFAGLALFILGSLIAALADHIYIVILGRALQGAGAIAAAIMAMVADTTSMQFRTRAMAVIGMSVGLAFLLAMVLGPLLGARYGLSGLFYIGAGLAVMAALILSRLPSTGQPRFHSSIETSPPRLPEVLAQPQLFRFNLGILCLHIVLMATFVVLPLILRDYTDLQNSAHWKLYLPVMLLSVLLMLPFVILSEKSSNQLPFYRGAVFLLLASQLGLFFWHQDMRWIALYLLVFFTAFNYLEASLPATVSKIINPESKGTALGIFSTCQFAGAFLGGLGGGLSFAHGGYGGVFMFNLLVVLGWFTILVWPWPVSTAAISGQLDHPREN